jgi:hypothetical protein
LSLAFGVLFALFVSLLIVPALYLIGWDWQQRTRRLKERLGVAQPVQPPQETAALLKSDQ